MSRIVSDKQFFNPYPYTNPTGINLHLCCKIQRSVLFVVPLLLITLQHRFCAGRVDAVSSVLVLVARPAVQLPEQLS